MCARDNALDIVNATCTLHITSFKTEKKGSFDLP